MIAAGFKDSEAATTAEFTTAGHWHGDNYFQVNSETVTVLNFQLEIHKLHPTTLSSSSLRRYSRNYENTTT